MRQREVLISACNWFSERTPASKKHIFCTPALILISINCDRATNEAINYRGSQFFVCSRLLVVINECYDRNVFATAKAPLQLQYCLIKISIYQFLSVLTLNRRNACRRDGRCRKYLMKFTPTVFRQ